MADKQVDLVSAGHICLDITPHFRPGAPGGDRPLERVFRPGSLTIVEPAAISTGGACANVGLSAQRLGLQVALMGKCGDDLLGLTLLSVLRQFSPQGPTVRHSRRRAKAAMATARDTEAGRDAEDSKDTAPFQSRNSSSSASFASLPAFGAGLQPAGMKIARGESTSYTVVLAVPGADRIFLHCPGANDTFTADDVDLDMAARARLFYFGYPTLMARMYAGKGQELARLMRSVKARGLTTALDMALPDPASPAGRADWPAILARALPHVDLFMPSVEEVTFMLRRDEYDRLVGKGDILDGLSAGLLRDLSGRCLKMGSAVVMIKCGRHGLYVRGGQRSRLAVMGSAVPKDLTGWADRELFAPSYKVPKVVSATGAGDSAVAGFLGALLAGTDLKTAADYACAAGAQNVQAVDATSGIKSWQETTAQLGNPRVAPPVAL